MIPYETYDVIEFAQDQSFIRWVQNKDEANNLFWEQWLQEHPEKVSTVEEAKQMVQSIQFKEKKLTSSDKDMIWEAISKTTEIEPKQNIFKILPRQWSYAAAILLVIIGTVLFWTLSSGTTIQTGNAESLAYSFPDNSQVELNASSKISYNEERWARERTLTLKGEAIFDVEKGSPFKIKTAVGEVEVLGTRFNVFVRNNKMEVNCFSGSVRVSSGSDNIVLSRGESVVFKNEVMSTESFQLEEKKIWQDGFFEFEDATFKDVFEEMERQFDIKIRASSEIMDLPYHGFFENKDLEKTFEEVCFTQRLKYTKVRTGVYLVEK